MNEADGEVCSDSEWSLFERKLQVIQDAHAKTNQTREMERWKCNFTENSGEVFSVHIFQKVTSKSHYTLFK